jgi:hypothetical protein
MAAGEAGLALQDQIVQIAFEDWASLYKNGRLNVAT